MKKNLTDKELRIKSNTYRRQVLSIIRKANAGHTGGSLSCVDMLNVLYNSVLKVSPETFTDPNRDRYVQSKGHSVEALYVVLADMGFFPFSDLDTLCRHNSVYIGHPTRQVNGIEHNTGALGHGLPFSVGVALGGKMDKASFRVFTLLGDGELAEGSNWEAALAAAHYRLDNLTAIVDCNRLQITGPTKEVCATEPLADKFRAFGWCVTEVDGHDVKALREVLGSRSPEAGKPLLIIANTIKGKGVRLMENQKKWHHGVPDDAQMASAIQDLSAEAEAIEAKS